MKKETYLKILLIFGLIVLLLLPSLIGSGRLIDSGIVSTTLWNRSGTDVFLHHTGDNVGIGTSSPDSIFHIKADVPGVVGNDFAGQIIIQNPDDDNKSNVVITAYESDGSGNPDQQLWYLGSSSGSNEDIIFLNRRDGKLALGTNDVVHMTILGNGSVGIGIASPTAKLHIYTLTSGEDLLFLRDQINTADLTINSPSGALMEIRAGVGDHLQLSSNNVANQGIRIRNDGNVGIGTSTPTHKLNVVGDLNVTGNYIGDGSLLTGIMGGIWANVSGTATYPSHVNITKNLTVQGFGGFFGSMNKTFLYGNANVIIGGFFDSGGYWGTTCYETDLTGIGGDNTKWCIDNGGNNLRFYDPTTSDVSMRANSTGWQIGDSSHLKDLLVSRDVYIFGNMTTNQFYGEMWYHNHTGTTLSFAVASTWYPMFFTEADNLNGFSYVGGFNSSSNLTTLVAGKYKASYRLSGLGQNNHIYMSTILINGIEQDRCGDHKKMAAGGDIVPIGSSCFIDLIVDDTIQVAVQDFGDTGNGDYYSGELNLVRIGK